MPIWPIVHLLISFNPFKKDRIKIFIPPAQQPMDAIIISMESGKLLGSIQFIHLLNKINTKNVIIEASEHINSADFHICCCAVLLCKFLTEKR